MHGMKIATASRSSRTSIGVVSVLLSINYRLCWSRVPDAVQRPSRCSAEPGPTLTLSRHGPRMISSALRRKCAALRGIRGVVPHLSPPWSGFWLNGTSLSTRMSAGQAEHALGR